MRSSNLTGDVGNTVTIRFQPIGSAPILRTKVFKISASQRFDTVVAFLRRRLDLVGAAKGGGKGRAGAESVFCYVNSCFAPGGDEVVGNLWRVSEILMWGCCAFWGGKGGR